MGAVLLCQGAQFARFDVGAVHISVDGHVFVFQDVLVGDEEDVLIFRIGADDRDDGPVAFGDLFDKFAVAAVQIHVVPAVAVALPDEAVATDEDHTGEWFYVAVVAVFDKCAQFFARQSIVFNEF